jgi:succinoglycan biosynthesis transport protein ExoP
VREDPSVTRTLRGSVQQAIRSKHVSAAPESKDVSLTDLWLVVRKRRMLIAGTALGAALVAGGWGFLHGKWYTATGEVRVQPGSGSEFKQSLSSVLGSGAGSIDVVIESDIRILESQKLLTTVAEKLDLQDNRTFMGKGFGSLLGNNAKSVHQSLENPEVRDAVIKTLRAHLTVARVPRTQMITIAYTSPSPKLSADVVNALENEFIENNFATHFNTTQQVSKWLTGQMDDLRGIVQNSQNQMVDLQRKLGVMALDPDHSLMVQDIGALQKNLADATEQRVLAEARYRIIKSVPPDQIQENSGLTGGAGMQPMNGAEGLLGNLRTQRASVEADLSRLQQVYGPNYPQVKQLRAQDSTLTRQISEQEQRVVQRANDSLDMARAAEAKAQALLNDKIHDVYGQRDDLVQYMLLSQEYDSNRKMYESIVGRLREAAVDAGLDAADISVVDLAWPPLKASSWSPLKLSLIGLLFGVFGGLTVGMLLEKMDTRLRDAHEIQEILGIPSLAMIPQSHWKSKGSELEFVAGPELLRDPRSPFSESFRALRTSMRLSTTSRESKAVAVTSCQPGEGKSTVSVNMAAVLAQGGKKVALVDTDMRRPSVYKRLRLEGGKGLSEVLTGYYTLEEVTQTHETLTTLDVIPSGTVPPLPADLLASDQMGEVVRQLRERYDYVIFDTPPLLSVTDPAIVAAQADGMVLVVRQGFCTRRMLGRAAEILHDLDVKVYGFVFNGVDASLPEYYGYLGYYTYEYGK